MPLRFTHRCSTLREIKAPQNFQYFYRSSQSWITPYFRCQLFSTYVRKLYLVRWRRISICSLSLGFVLTRNISNFPSKLKDFRIIYFHSFCPMFSHDDTLYTIITHHYIWCATCLVYGCTISVLAVATSSSYIVQTEFTNQILLHLRGMYVVLTDLSVTGTRFETGLIQNSNWNFNFELQHYQNDSKLLTTP